MRDLPTIKFYLGTHQPHWLGTLAVPLFVSHRRLWGRRTFPRARVGWALDSGGFSELSMHGEWRTKPAHYVDAVRQYQGEIGSMDWAAPMDWMCEPAMLAKTGRNVRWHQEATVENYLQLRQAAPEVPWIPVLQGWGLHDYLACVGLYDAAGVDLTAEPVVGVGSVCRRQSSDEIGTIFGTLAGLGIACHGFGVKTQGLAKYHRHLVSADSMSWSYAGRRDPPLPGCVGHKNCANCWRYALRWRRDVLRTIINADA